MQQQCRGGKFRRAGACVGDGDGPIKCLVKRCRATDVIFQAGDQVWSEPKGFVGSQVHNWRGTAASVCYRSHINEAGAAI